MCDRLHASDKPSHSVTVNVSVLRHMHTPFLQHSPSLHGGLHTSGVGRVGNSSTQDYRHYYVHLLIMIK